MTNTQTPARTLPRLYLGTAHAALILACVVTGWWPESIAGFFYHTWILGGVHLVTLGWITFSILGAIYIVAPVALPAELPVRRWDYAAYACALIGLVDMVGHFWIQEYGDMAWSAGTIAAGVAFMTVRIARSVSRANIQPAVKAHVILACVNFWIAASMGLRIAIDKVAHFLPGFVLSNVLAHAHLAAIGWVGMMIAGISYRLLPMTFPSKMPPGRSIYSSAVLLETGVLGLFVMLLLRSAWAVAFGILIVGGFAAAGSHVVWMLGHPAPRPPALRKPDFARLHAAEAGVWLVAAIAIGLTLLVLPATPRTLHLAAAYGVLGILGFLAQMVVAMEARLLPTATWFWTYRASEYREAPPSPHTMRDRMLQTIVFAGWTVGVPLLAAGMYLESSRLVGIGAWALVAGVSIAALDTVFVIALSFRRVE
jgi:hypothetical protein